MAVSDPAPDRFHHALTAEALRAGRHVLVEKPLAATVHASASGAVVVPTFTDGDAYQRQVEAFARTIRAGGHPVPGVRDGLAAVRLIEATATAVQTSSEVKL